MPASVIFSFASLEKIPQGLCFQVKVLVAKRPQKMKKPFFPNASFLKCFFLKWFFMILLHAELHLTRLRINRVLCSGKVTPISLESLSCLTGRPGSNIISSRKKIGLGRTLYLTRYVVCPVTKFRASKIFPEGFVHQFVMSKVAGIHQRAKLVDECQHSDAPPLENVTVNKKINFFDLIPLSDSAETLSTPQTHLVVGHGIAKFHIHQSKTR